MKYPLSAAAFLAAMLLSGCANPIYEGSLSWEDGWRKGQITAIGEGVAFAKKLDANCGVSTSGPPTDGLYATIQYRNNGRLVWRTVVTPPDSPWEVNDLVYVNTRDCRNSVVRRTG